MSETGGESLRSTLSDTTASNPPPADFKPLHRRLGSSDAPDLGIPKSRLVYPSCPYKITVAQGLRQIGIACWREIAIKGVAGHDIEIF